MDLNKLDPYENFDPTQEQGDGCGCSGIYWDMVTQTWRKRATKQPSKPDCSELEKELKQTQADLAEMARKAEEKQARITELEKQLAEQPTVCDVLKAHTRPVQSLNGQTAYYVVDGADCEGLSDTVAGLDGDVIHNAEVPEPVRSAPQ